MQVYFAEWSAESKELSWQRQNYSGFRMYDVLVYDFNGDEKLDLGYSDVYMNAFVIRYQQPHQGYLFDTTPLVGVNEPVGYGEFADYDGDNITDVVGFRYTSYPDQGEVVVMKGIGSALADSMYTVATYDAWIPVAKGDFNEDGYMDVATSRLEVLFGRGDGGFDIVRNGYANYINVEFVDVDDDGNIDAVCSDLEAYDVRIVVGWGQEDSSRFTGEFELEEVYRLEGGWPGFRVTPVDLEGDGTQEVLFWLYYTEPAGGHVEIVTDLDADAQAYELSTEIASTAACFAAEPSGMSLYLVRAFDSIYGESSVADVYRGLSLSEGVVTYSEHEVLEVGSRISGIRSEDLDGDGDQEVIWELVGGIRIEDLYITTSFQTDSRGRVDFWDDDYDGDLDLMYTHSILTMWNAPSQYSGCSWKVYQTTHRS